MSDLRVDREHGGAPEGLVDLSVSLNPLGPPPEASAALAAAASGLSRYPDPRSTRLRRAFAARYGVPEETILLGPGSTAVFYALARALPVARPLVVVPTFSEIANALVVEGRRPAPVRLRAEDRFAWPAAELEERLRAGADAVFLGRPNSPTGSLVPASDLSALAAACEAREAWCVVDEAFLDFVPGEASLAAAVPRTRRLVVVRSITKTYAVPGARVGCAVAPPDLVARIEERTPPWSIDAGAEAVALACLRVGDEYRTRTHAVVAELRRRLARGLSEAGLEVFPSAANFVLARDPRHDESAPLHRELARRGFAVRDLASLPGAGAGWLRVGLRPAADLDRLLEALRGIRPEGPATRAARRG